MEEDCLGMASPQVGAAVPPPVTARHHHPGAQEGYQDMEVAAQEDHHQLVLNMEHRRLQLYQVMEAQVQLLLLDIVHHLQVVAHLSSSH